MAGILCVNGDAKYSTCWCLSICYSAGQCRQLFLYWVGDWHQYQAIIETSSDSPSVLRTMMINTSPSHRDDIISLSVTGMFRTTISMIDFEVYFSKNVARRSTRTYPYEHEWFIQELIYWPLLCIETGNDKHKYLIISMVTRGSNLEKRGNFYLRIDFGSQGVPEWESDGCHFGIFERFFFRRPWIYHYICKN